jgi:hypothetical protein
VLPSTKEISRFVFWGGALVSVSPVFCIVDRDISGEITPGRLPYIPTNKAKATITAHQ